MARNLRYIKTILLLCLLFFIITTPVSAGIGIVWTIESDVVSEGQKSCIPYGSHNPFSSDTKAILRAELKAEGKEPLIAESDIISVPAGTSDKGAVSINLCFIPKNIYKKDCWVSDFLICEQKCSEEEITFTGEVSAMEIKDTGAKATGSAVMAIASAPLELKIKCIPHKRDFSFIYIILTISLASAATLLVLKKKK